jgi:hypothetical protein
MRINRPEYGQASSWTDAAVTDECLELTQRRSARPRVSNPEPSQKGDWCGIALTQNKNTMGVGRQRKRAPTPLLTQRMGTCCPIDSGGEMVTPSTDWLGVSLRDIWEREPIIDAAKSKGASRLDVSVRK